MRARFTRWAVVALLAVVAGQVPVSAAAHPETAAGRGGTEPGTVAPQFLLVVRSAGVEAARTATLSCDPAVGGSHPDGIAACAQLRDAQGHVERIPASVQSMCTAQYDPVTVELHGRWGSQSRYFTGEFGNSCEAVAATGGVVFRF
ncbi:subtilisin inhibitor-like [Stackebrandtia albiflava]|uniref:Subtilisin inhibitor-like n=1 Tax=Stackebrandtia albiflava TaxID=406432 RepID=A0A562V1Y6_9ACTN|nr:SSI family serine proteinase inhibitor [Stackebrandtia albiflava]TWJ11822.1 subtilisin inhibitor-like [Stackebrandtia albiflava]